MSITKPPAAWQRRVRALSAMPGIQAQGCGRGPGESRWPLHRETESRVWSARLPVMSEPGGESGPGAFFYTECDDEYHRGLNRGDAPMQTPGESPGEPPAGAFPAVTY